MNTKNLTGDQTGCKRVSISLSYMILFLFLTISIRAQQAGEPVPESPVQNSELRIGTFDLDVTPPNGYPLAYDTQVNTWDMGIRAKGIVILGAEEPIVLCAVDAIGISNDGHDEFRIGLAYAAKTTIDRVSIHALHQHDAPRFDPGAERALLEAGQDPGAVRSEWGRKAIRDLVPAIRKAIENAQPVDQMGLGSAPIHKVASNRTVYRGVDGKVIRPRFSSTGQDTLLRKLPIGTVDSIVSLVSFWNGEKPVAILSFFAVHPQSYYRTGIVNPDFVGVARFMRQLAVPDALHVHFNGASGNIAAGKYNDGAHINRLILAKRMEDGLRRAWESTVKQKISAADIGWFSNLVALPLSEEVHELAEKIESGEWKVETLSQAYRIARWRQYKAGKEMQCASLRIKNAGILFMPGELFVEYQLNAKAMRPDLFVTMAAYGDYGASYVGTAEAYEYGGYETERGSTTTAQAEEILLKVIENLLKD